MVNDPEVAYLSMIEFDHTKTLVHKHSLGENSNPLKNTQIIQNVPYINTVTHVA